MIRCISGIVIAEMIISLPGGKERVERQRLKPVRTVKVVRASGW